MTNPFMPQPQQAPPAQPQQPAGNPYAPQPQPQQPQGNPYAPQPQQPAQPQYAPPAQPQYTQQPAQHAYAPQPQYAPQQQAPAGLIARPGQFNAPPPPSASGASGMPKVSDLQGRLLIVLPETIQRAMPSRFTGPGGAPQTQDRLTATVIVLDGGNGPFTWTRAAQGQQPQTQTQGTPFVIKGLWIQQTKLIEQLEEALAMRLRGEPGISLGRLWKTGPSNSDPYVLASPNPQEVAEYDAYVSQVNPFAL
jgi:hypothetical protein